MPTSVVKETLAVYAHAIDAVDLSKRATLQTVRSWSGIVESTFPFPEGWYGPWNLADAALESGEALVTAQTEYAQGILDASAVALGVVNTKGAPPIAGRPNDEKVAARTSGTPRPAAKAETATASPSAPKPAVKVETAAATATATAPSRPKAPAAPAKTVAAKPKAPKVS